MWSGGKDQDSNGLLRLGTTLGHEGHHYLDGASLFKEVSLLLLGA